MTVPLRLSGVLTLVGCIALALASCGQPADGVARCECGAAPRCGEACTARCGCCPEYGSTCSANGIIVGKGSCYETIPCSGPGRCVVGNDGPVCAESTNNCEAVRTAYESGLRFSLAVRAKSAPLAPGAYSTVECPEACHVSQGHCAQGLDTCWLLPYYGTSDSELDRIANLYAALGCPALAACDCPPAPITSCQFPSDGATGTSGRALTCMVE